MKLWLGVSIFSCYVGLGTTFARFVTVQFFTIEVFLLNDETYFRSSVRRLTQCLLSIHVLDNRVTILYRNPTTALWRAQQDFKLLSIDWTAEDTRVSLV